MLFNKSGDPLITISEAKKIIDKSEETQGYFETIVEGHQYVVDKKIYPEVVSKDIGYYKASQLGVTNIED
ncbi:MULTISPECIES: hypothetical protein [Staphylococcus]|uniref:hypothetical protein n=1 Tax=Staphylococcus TaxID=1279 RepID=UPI000DE3315D|nr:MULTISPECIES: hypothetical protein [Staphylococcus]MCO4327878.1 hypothetical protein [Staphylococcus agnetis]MDN8674527.1 hypothetical protein [Staphylococcus aureus]MDN8977680.1 hypothetical protein [Staphylococcus aureus]HDF3152083.1 hypothetical protein [Staphylococcus aureus]